MRLLKLIACITALTIFVACGSEELVARVDARQSVEMLVVLQKAGIRVEREKLSSGNTDLYRITVNSNDYAKALQILNDYGLPRKDENALEVLTRQQAFSPQTPAILSLRRDMALALQVENLLVALPGVVDARVVVRGDSEGSNLLRVDNQAPRATVVIRYVSDTADAAFSIEQVKNIVAQAVPGLDLNSISVTTTRVLTGIMGADDKSLDKNFSLFAPFRFRIAAADLLLAQKQIIGVGVICVLFGIMAGIAIVLAISTFIRRKETPGRGVAALDPKLTVEANPAKLISRKPTLMINSKDLDALSKKE